VQQKMDVAEGAVPAIEDRNQRLSTQLLPAEC